MNKQHNVGAFKKMTKSRQPTGIVVDFCCVAVVEKEHVERKRNEWRICNA